MAPILLWLILVLCLLISAVKYLMGIILKFSFASTKAKKDYAYQPTVSVLMPCYNEGKTVYETIESISKSNYPNDKFEVIAQDDCSVDDSYEWMLKAQRDFTNIRVSTGRNEVNSGRPVPSAMPCGTQQRRSSSPSILIASSIRTRFGNSPPASRSRASGRWAAGWASETRTTVSSPPSRRSFTILRSSFTRFPKIGPAVSAASADVFSPSAASYCWRSSPRFAPATGLEFP